MYDEYKVNRDTLFIVLSVFNEESEDSQHQCFRCRS